MTSDGSPLQQKLQQLLPAGVPCPDCGEWGLVQILNFKVVPQRVINPKQTMGQGQGTDGYSICLACGIRRSWKPNLAVGKWELVQE